MNKIKTVHGVKILRADAAIPQENFLTNEALHFITELHRKFNSKRIELLQKRKTRQEEISRGIFPTFLEETKHIRESAWSVAPAPQDLNDRRVEITGPVERKMMINALNSGARVFMADFEDATSPTWSNIILGQANCYDAVRRTLSFTSPEGKNYSLREKTATLVIRPRGWHLEERNLTVDGTPISASLFDFGLYFFHNAKELISRGSGPYFYLPKMESHLEARLWNDVFNFSQDYLEIPRGTIRATCLIETILAAYEMDEILYELKNHAAGLNAGRWDYIFSVIKKFSNHRAFILPDRIQVSMTVPFMRTYSELLVQTCHKRNAHAIGGMAAFIPSRKDAAINETALSKVHEDKRRESADGFDGTWVAHPDLVPVAMEDFNKVLGVNPNQKHRKREDAEINPTKLIDTKIENSTISENGIRQNINVALQYIDSWLRGIGAAAIHNLMEDAATAEISRAELWQWIRHEVKTSEGLTVDTSLYLKIRNEEVSKLKNTNTSRLEEAAEILDYLVLNKEFPEFLTTVAYDYLESTSTHTQRSHHGYTQKPSRSIESTLGN